MWFHLGTKGYRDGREYKIEFVFLKYIIRGFFSVISGFRREVYENCSSLGYNAVTSGKPYHYSLRNSPEERSFQGV